jgi:thiol reductant ABC exporter CydD subunit
VSPIDRRLLLAPGPTRRFLSAATVLTGAAAALLVVQSVLLADAIAGAVDRGATVHVGVAVGIAAAFAGRGACGLVVRVLGARAAGTVAADWRRRALAVTLAPDRSAADDPRRGELATLLGAGLDGLEQWYTGFVPAVVAAAVTPAVVVVALVAVDPPSALVAVLTLPVVPLFLALIGMRAQAATERELAALLALSGHFLEVVRGLPTLELFGRAARQTRVIAGTTEQLRAATMRTLRVAFLSGFVLDVFAMLGTAVVAVVAGVRLVEGAVPLQVALTALLLIPEAYLPLRRAGRQFHASREGAEVVRRVLDLLAERSRDGAPPIPADDATARPAGADAIAAAGAPDPAHDPITCTAVTVRHPGRPQPALADVDLELPAQRLTALTGPSGSGKTTLGRLLVGLERPDEGGVLVGGIDLRAIDRHSWARRVAWVPQHPVIASGRLRDYLTTGLDAPPPDAVIWASLARAVVDDVARELGGLDAPVGPGGRLLSGGERRRLAVARALLRRPRLLVADEPTAHLDVDSEAAVVRALREERGRATVIVCTHRPAVARAADLVVSLDAGRVAQPVLETAS